MASSSIESLSYILHPDIIQTHILPKLDGPSLLAVGSTSSDLRSLCSDNKLWKDICHYTWPSLNDPLVSDVLSTFPSGYRSFYQDSFPILHSTDESSNTHAVHNRTRVAPELISAVDIRYKNKLVYSKVQLTNTATYPFLSAPLCVEFVEPNPTVRPGFSRVNFDEQEEEFLADVEESVTLNWILIDPKGKRAGNFSCVRPISVRRDWLTNEVQLQFVTILSGTRPSELVQCRIEVTCEGKEGAELHVREVIMKLHDMESKCLTGEESLVILERAMRGERRRLGKRGEEKEKYEEFLKMKRERIGRRVRRESMKAKINRVIPLAIFVVLLVCVSEVFLI